MHKLDCSWTWTEEHEVHLLLQNKICWCVVFDRQRLCSDPVTSTTPFSNLCKTCYCSIMEAPICFWLPWEWWQGLSLSHHCCSHQCSAVALPLLRRKNLLLTHILFWSRKLFLDATGLTHQPEFKSPTTGFSSFCFIASILFLQNKRRSFWAHAETYSQCLSLLCWAQVWQKPCSMPVCFWSLEKMSFFLFLHPRTTFQHKYQIAINKGSSSPIQVQCSLLTQSSHDLQAVTSYCLAHRPWQSLVNEQLEALISSLWGILLAELDPMEPLFETYW